MATICSSALAPYARGSASPDLGSARALRPMSRPWNTCCSLRPLVWWRDPRSPAASTSWSCCCRPRSRRPSPPRSTACSRTPECSGSVQGRLGWNRSATAAARISRLAVRIEQSRGAAATSTAPRCNRPCALRGREQGGAITACRAPSTADRLSPLGRPCTACRRIAGHRHPTCHLHRSGTVCCCGPVPARTHPRTPQCMSPPHTAPPGSWSRGPRRRAGLWRRSSVCRSDPRCHRPTPQTSCMCSSSSRWRRTPANKQRSTSRPGSAVAQSTSRCATLRLWPAAPLYMDGRTPRMCPPPSLLRRCTCRQ